VFNYAAAMYFDEVRWSLRGGYSLRMVCGQAHSRTCDSTNSSYCMAAATPRCTIVMFVLAYTCSPDFLSSTNLGRLCRVCHNFWNAAYSSLNYGIKT